MMLVKGESVKAWNHFYANIF